METHERLRFARRKLGYTQQEFADGVGLKQGSYSDLERGKVKSISDSTFMLLELNFGVNRKWLVDGEGNMLVKTDSGIVESPEANYGTSNLLEVIDIQAKEIERLKNIILKIDKLCKDSI